MEIKISTGIVNPFKFIKTNGNSLKYTTSKESTIGAKFKELESCSQQSQINQILISKYPHQPFIKSKTQVGYKRP